jgi:two-component system sensor histidine kinase EvgS
MILKKILSLLIILFQLSLSADIAYHDNKKEAVSIQLKWKHSFQFAGYYAAIEKGYYADEGLSVTLKERSSKQNYIQAVVDGDAEYGISDSSLVVVRLQQKPVVLVTQIFQYSPLVLISHRDSNITTPYDFIGKKLMYAVNGTGDTPFKALILKTIGSFDKIKTSPFTTYQDFIDRKVDVTSAYSTSQPYWLKKQGIEVNIIDPKSYGIDFYGDNLFTTQSEIKNHPLRVSKMKKATIKGWKYALAHPEEIIDIILKKYAPNKERDALEFEARSTYQMIMPDFINLGSFREEKYTRVVKTYKQLGIVSQATIPNDFYYHDHVNKLTLTQEEQHWIKNHPIIKVGGGPDWAPFDFINSKGKYTGISNDYLQLLSQKTGLKFQVIVDKWVNNLKKMKEQKIDLLHAVYYTKERDTYMHYTKPYFEMLDYFFIRDDLNITTLKDLDLKRVAMPKGYAHAEILKKEFPNIHIVTVDTFSDAIDAVLSNKADILFDTYASISYKLKQEKISTIIPFKAYRGKNSSQLYMAASQNNPLLAKIIDKGLALITPQEKEQIYTKWLSKKRKKVHSITLTDQEKKWLEKHPSITLAGDPHWLPFEAFDKNGKYIGIVADYLQEIEKYIPLHFKPHQTHSWQETLELSKKKTIDIISGDIDDTILKRNYNPITPYVKTPIVIIMRNDHSFVNDIQDIQDKRIAIIKKYGYNYALKKKYPLLSFIEELDVKSALNKLSNFHYDALILSLPAAAYFIKTEGLYNLRIVGKTGIEMQPTLFVHKNEPILHQLLEKAISKMEYNTNTSILNKWQNIEFAQKTDYQLLFQIAGLLGLFLLGTLYWNRKLSHEIEKRKEVEHILQEKKIQIERDNYLINSIFNATDDLIFYKDSSLRYLGANQAYLQLMGKKREEIVGKDDFQLFNKELAALFRQHDIHTLKENSITTKKEFIKTKNGKEIYLLTQKVPFLYDKEHTGILGISRDITEIHLSELKAQEANQAKSEFLANMSHEIRTPMNSVLGFSELLEKQISDPIQKDYLEAIQRGGKALLNIINDILDLSKIEAGKLEIVLESVNIKQLAIEMESIFSIQLIQKNLHFELDIDPTLPQYLLLDNTRLRQVLFNLLGNAIKFTSHGKITLAIKKLKEDTQKSKIDLQISVQDSGIGIAKENIKYIFDAFEQQHGQDQKFGGTGLGLAISKKLIMMMHGDITVESEIGKGSIFTIQLHDIPISSIEAEQETESKSFQNIHFKKATILVVDDIKDNRKLITSTLQEYNLEVQEATNGKEAIERLKNIKVDLILMDIKMPIMDGYEATKIIKTDEKLSTIPLIALTASVMGKDLEKIEKYQFDGYLRKPISQETLLEEIANFLPYDLESPSADASEDIDDQMLQNLPNTIALLEKEYLPKWREIKDMGDFSLISDFSIDLEKLAQEYKIAHLKKYASQLHTYCESFDIDKVDFLMNSFPATIEKLKGLQDV